MLPRARMRKTQRSRMQRDARHQRALLCFFALFVFPPFDFRQLEFGAAAVQVVHGKWIADRGEMYTYLVQPAGVDACLYKREIPETFQYPEVCTGCFAARVDEHFIVLDRRACQGFVNGAAVFYHLPLHERPVYFFYAAVLKVQGQSAVRISMARKNQGPTRLLVQTVHDEYLAVPFFQEVLEIELARCIAVGHGQNHGGLVDHHNVLIFVDDS